MSVSDGRGGPAEAAIEIGPLIAVGDKHFIRSSKQYYLMALSLVNE